MNPVAVSLLIPCYNAAGFLPRLFASVAGSSTPFAEVLCYDDGSTDDSVRVAESFGVRVIRGEGSRRGPSVGRNRLAAEATCEWVHFQDADDPVHPEFVSRTTQTLGPDVDVVAVNCDWLNSETREVTLRFHFRQAEVDADPLAYFLTHPMSIHGTIYRREFFLRSGGFDESKRCWEDADLHVRLAAASGRIRFVEEVLAHSLRHDNGLSRDQKYCWECRTRFLERYAVDLPERVRPAIAAEAERAAVGLLAEGDSKTANDAVRLARSLGRAVPDTRNPLLRIARAVLPPLTVLRVQRWFRRGAG